MGIKPGGIKPAGVKSPGINPASNNPPKKGSKWGIVILLVLVLGAVYFFFGKDYMALHKDFNPTPKEYTDQVLGAYQKRMADYRAMQSGKTIATGTGERYVIADRLCLRRDASTNLKPMGELVAGAKVQVLDSSNSEWYRIANPVAGLQERQQGKTYQYYNGAGELIIESDKPLRDMPDVYVASRYLGTQAPAMGSSSLPENPQHPFVFGLQFYNDQIAKMLAVDVWQKMGSELQSRGYDGVKFVNTGSGTDKNAGTEQKITKHEVDGMQTSPACYSRIMKGKEDGVAFAMQTFKNDGEAHDYSGYIIVNKDSDIKSLSDLKGKNIFTGKDGSMSSYTLQMRALEKLGLKKEDLHLYSGLYHYQLFTAVAEQTPMDFSDPKNIHAADNGVKADAAFVGDFVLQSSLFEDFATNKKFGLKVYQNAAELNTARNSVYILPIAMERIPEQPLLLSKKLYDDTAFRNEFRQVLMDFYDAQSEKYGIAEATPDVYKNMPPQE